MQITVRIIGVETLADNKPHTVDLPEDITLGEAVEIILRELQLNIDRDKLAKSSFLVNNCRVYTDYKLQNGDYLRILRTLEGG